MRARSFCSLALVATAGSLLAAGWGGVASAKTAVTWCHARVGASSNANGVLWARGGSKPAVYAVVGTKVIAPSGVSSVPAGGTGIGFWACSPHSLLYTSDDGVLRMSGADGPTTIGANGVAAPNGWFLTYDGATIRYTNGEKLVARGIGDGWQIATVAVNPRNPHIVFAGTVSPEQETEHCKVQAGIAYRVTRAKTSTVLRWTPCHGDPLIGWSPDGTLMSFVRGSRQTLYIADAYGRAAASVAPDVSGYLWSPDGSRIAYNVSNARTPRVAVVDVATGATRILAAGTLGAWSPDGKDVAVVSGSSVIGVPAAGGHPQTLASLS